MRGRPSIKTPVTKPSTVKGKRTVRKQELGIAMPHKGNPTGRKPTLGEQYPRQ